MTSQQIEYEACMNYLDLYRLSHSARNKIMAMMMPMIIMVLMK